MISRWRWALTLLTRRLWFRAAIYGVVAIVSALLATVASPLVPEEIAGIFGADSVQDILKILASSMLAVATFSLGIMVSAFSAAASTATPRASKLLVEDSTSQNVLSTFIGAFIFGLVGIIALNTHYYGAGGRAILFFVTLGVVALTLVTFFRWIDYLSNLGRLSTTIEKVEKAATGALSVRRRSPYLASMPLQAIPASAFPLFSESVGYIQHLDVASLAKTAKNSDGLVYVKRLPGAFAAPTEPLAWTSWQPDEAERQDLVEAFLIENARTFEQDPRFGLIVLSEIASRALSPGINDPGTAIDIIGRLVRILSIWAEEPDEEADEILYEQVFIPALATGDLFDDAFTPIARDGAGTLEVGIRLQKAFAMLARTGPEDVRQAACRHSELAMKRSLVALALDEDKRIIEGLAAKVG